MPTGRLLAIIHPAHDDADQNASNDRSRQIVPQQQTPLSERHTAALLQWQPFAAILELSRFEISPRNVARLYQTTCGGFLFPATHQSMPPGFKPPQHLPHRASRLANNSTAPFRSQHPARLRYSRRIPQFTTVLSLPAIPTASGWRSNSRPGN